MVKNLPILWETQVQSLGLKWRGERQCKGSFAILNGDGGVSKGLTDFMQIRKLRLS